MLDSTREVLFLSAKRTAFGAFGGVFRDLRATDPGVVQEVARDEHPRRQSTLGTPGARIRGRGGLYRWRPRYCSDSGIVVIGVWGDRRQSQPAQPMGTRVLDGGRDSGRHTDGPSFFRDHFGGMSPSSSAHQQRRLVRK